MSSDNVVNLTNDTTEQRKLIVAITWIIVLLVPVYARVNTENGSMIERTYFWPWMILVKLTPESDYNSEQFNVIGFPWSFLLFIPTFYVFKLSWDLLKVKEEDKVKYAGYILVVLIIQLGLIAMTFLSQAKTFDGRSIEDRNVYYWPHWILILIYIIFVSLWFYRDTQNVLQQSKLRKNKNNSS